MNQHINYWKEKDARARLAKRRVFYNDEHHLDDIKSSIDNSLVIDGEKGMLKFMEPSPGFIPITRVLDEDVSYCIFNTLGSLGITGKTAVLNFASYTSPGGKFINGSSAQEECLCMNSTLYNILSSKKIVNQFYTKNRKERTAANGLYTDRLVYTPNVIFDDITGSNPTQRLDVITCAAPFYKKARAHGVEETTILQTMKKRIDFIFEVANTMGVKNIILGAYGCGVFGNDTEFVAECFADALINNPHAGHIDNALFPILPGYNYDKFCDVFTRVFNEYANKDNK